MLETTAGAVEPGDRILSQATGQVLTVTATAKREEGSSVFVYLFYDDGAKRDALFTKTAARTPVDIIPQGPQGAR